MIEFVRRGRVRTEICRSHWELCTFPHWLRGQIAVRPGDSDGKLSVRIRDFGSVNDTAGDNQK